MTAVASPLVNSLMFGMPAFGSLPSILLKSVLLAIAAYAGGGTFLSGNFYDAVQDFRIGVPGMLLQIFGGYLFVKYLIRKVMMFGIGTQEIIFIVLIVRLFFGGKKIPELMKGLGKGVRSFKEGVRGIENDN